MLVENRDEFIDALYEIIYSFYFDEHGRGKPDDPQYISYVNAVFSFYENSLEFKEPSNTWGLIYVAKALADGVKQVMRGKRRRRNEPTKVDVCRNISPFITFINALRDPKVIIIFFNLQ